MAGPGKVFDGSTLPGPSNGNAPAEGTVFNGQSVIPGGTSGGGTGGNVTTPGSPPVGPGTGTGGGYPTTGPATPTATLMLVSNPSADQEFDGTYLQTNTGFGGVQPYSFFLVGGAFPEGVTLNTNNGSPNNVGEVSGVPLSAGPYTYTIEVQDSTGVVAISQVAGGTYGGGGPNSYVAPPGFTTSGPNQLIMVVCITANSNPSAPTPTEITALGTPGSTTLTFTRVFHSEALEYHDSSDGSNPYASISIDVFTAPAPTQITSAIAWQATMSGGGSGLVYVFNVSGLSDINNPFDTDVSTPNVAVNTSGTSSTVQNTDISTAAAGTTLFAVTVNHTNSGSDATPAQPSGWTPLGSHDSAGGSAGFAGMVSSQFFEDKLTAQTITGGFADNYWASVIFAFKGPGGDPQTATNTITGTITAPTPGSQTFTYSDGASGIFPLPPFNNLTIILSGGSDEASTATAATETMTANAGEYDMSDTYNITSSFLGGIDAVYYTLGSGSPAGEITFMWN